MRNLIFLTSVLLALPGPVAVAATRTLFFPGGQRAQVLIQAPAFGPSDRDAEVLSSAMQRRELRSADGAFKLVCGQASCALTVLESGNSKISQPLQLVEFVLQGPEALPLTQGFKPNTAGGFEFLTEDHLFSIRGTPTEFHVSYKR